MVQEKPQNEADPVLLSEMLNASIDKRLEILRRIAYAGSISEAARGAGVSYKAAWQSLETLSNLAGGPLVEKVVGGKAGGGTKLTPRGEDVLRLAEELARARAVALSRFQNKDLDLPMLAGNLMLSIRNQIPATVHTLKWGAALVRLLLKIDDSHLIRASVTKESAQLLGLREGERVIALAKATGVVVSAMPPDTHDNLLEGTIVRMDRGEHGGECTVQLDSGLLIVGFLAPGHGLKRHDRAWVLLPCDTIAIGISRAPGALPPEGETHKE